MIYSKALLFIIFLFLMGCSAAYKEIKKIETKNPNSFHQYLLYNYKQKATFEAEEMHDWNSAKLYSEKALRAQEGEYIYPEEISYWKISLDRILDIKTAYNNLLSIYNEALITDPKNLAQAISSLDCWSEQEEEKWQTWDIEECKNDFHSSMHELYRQISIQNNDKSLKKANKENVEDKSNVAVVTQNNQKEIMQIIYFDFDNSRLSNVSKNTLISFLRKNKNVMSRFIILGHTDTKGSQNYNLVLSLKRAEAVKQILLNEGILKKNVSVLGRGENQLAISTLDDTKHPINRRAEIKILN